MSEGYRESSGLSPASAPPVVTVRGAMGQSLLRCGMRLQISLVISALCSVAVAAEGKPPPQLETRESSSMTRSGSPSSPRAVSGAAPDSGVRGGGGDLDARVNRDAKRRVWLTVTLAGLATSAAVIAGTSWWMRERHAKRWNSSQCLAVGRPREDVCSGELNAGEAAGRMALGSSIVSGLLFVGAGISFMVDLGGGAERRSVAVTRCGAQWASVGCSGTF